MPKQMLWPAFVMLMASVCTQACSEEVPRSVQTCATFTPNGNLLKVTVSAADVAIVLKYLSGKTMSVSLPINAPAGLFANSDQSCSVFIDRTGDEAAIEIPFAIPIIDNKPAGQTMLVVRFDLTSANWQTHFLLDPPAGGFYQRTSRLMGYLAGTKTLYVAQSDGRGLLYGENNELLESRDIFRIGRAMSIYGLFVGVDTADNRLWSSCLEPQGLFAHPTSCSLKSNALTGPDGETIEIKSPHVTNEKSVQQWVGPVFFAYPSSSTLVFGGYPENRLARSHFIWIANLVDGTVQQIRLHSSFHDDSMTGQFALSSDGDFLAFSVSMSKLGCCFVDNYIDEGGRLLIVDIKNKRQVAEVRPLDHQHPLGFAIDHRDGKIVLLVNWGKEWERTEYSDQH
jgi:hypothetical protein